MRIVGGLVLVIGLVLAVVLAVWPVQVMVVGSTASCGRPAVTAFTVPAVGVDPVADAFAVQCVTRSHDRLLVAYVAFSAGLIGGTLMMVGPALFRLAAGRGS